jgi:hypothetical protein
MVHASPQVIADFFQWSRLPAYCKQDEGRTKWQEGGMLCAAVDGLPLRKLLRVS